MKDICDEYTMDCIKAEGVKSDMSVAHFGGVRAGDLGNDGILVNE